MKCDSYSYYVLESTMRKQTKENIDETLTTLRIISSRTNSPPVKVSSEWVSEWLVFVTSAIFQLYHGENKLLFNVMRGIDPVIVAKTYISNLVRTIRFWNNIQRDRQQQPRSLMFNSVDSILVICIYSIIKQKNKS
jgi:hypothetical protein